MILLLRLGRDPCLLYICMELTYDRVAGKRPAPVKSDRLKEFASRRRCGLSGAKNFISKKFDTRGAFAKNHQFPVILGLVDATDSIHSSQSPIGTHIQRGDN
jgi:hypothetical protein